MACDDIQQGKVTTTALEEAAKLRNSAMAKDMLSQLRAKVYPLHSELVKMPHRFVDWLMTSIPGHISSVGPEAEDNVAPFGDLPIQALELLPLLGPIDINQPNEQGQTILHKAVAATEMYEAANSSILTMTAVELTFRPCFPTPPPSLPLPVTLSLPVVFPRRHVLVAVILRLGTDLSARDKAATRPLSSVRRSAILAVFSLRPVSMLTFSIIPSLMVSYSPIPGCPAALLPPSFGPCSIVWRRLHSRITT